MRLAGGKGRIARQVAEYNPQGEERFGREVCRVGGLWFGVQEHYVFTEKLLNNRKKP
jgi:hypothetical protein